MIDKTPENPELQAAVPPTSPTTPTLDAWSYSASDLDKEEFPPVQMVVPGILPVGLAVLGGKPKSGKSFFSLQLCFAVAQGTRFLDHTLDQGDALYFALEDHQQRIQDRGRKLNYGAPLPERLRIYKQGKERITMSEIEGLIEEWAAAVDDPTLVVIDTMVRAMPRRPHNTDDYSHNTQVLGSLQEVALRLGIAILLIHHESKRVDSADDFDTMLGSTGINGTADTLMLLKHARGSNVGELSVTGRDLPERMSIPLEVTGGRWTLSGIRDHREVIDVTDLELKVLLDLANGHNKSSEISDALDTSQSNVSNRLKGLVDSGYVNSKVYGEYELAPGVREKLNELSGSSETSETAQSITTSIDPDLLAIDPMQTIKREFEF